jgi:hypothetical protein
MSDRLLLLDEHDNHGALIETAVEALSCRMYKSNQLSISALSRAGVIPDESAEFIWRKLARSYPNVSITKEPLINRGNVGW